MSRSNEDHVRDSRCAKAVSVGEAGKIEEKRDEAEVGGDGTSTAVVGRAVWSRGRTRKRLFVTVVADAELEAETDGGVKIGRSGREGGRVETTGFSTGATAGGASRGTVVWPPSQRGTQS